MLKSVIFSGMNYRDISIIVVGSGLSGSTFVAAIAPWVREVIWLDRESSQTAATVSDQRPLSLSYTTVVLLQNLGLWDSLSPYSGPIKQVHVSEQGRLGSLLLSAVDMDVAALGYVVPYVELEKIVFDAATARKNVRRIYITEIDSIDEQEGVAIHVATTAGSETIHADYLVAADGLHSRCRELLHIKTRKKDHHDRALTAMITLKKPHDCCAYERFTKRGVLALLPMWDRYQYRLVWTLDRDEVNASTHEDVLAAVETTFGTRIGAITGLELMGSYPLSTTIALQQATQRCVLLGDSAHRIYPIAAQGYNLTARDCAALVDCIVQSQELSVYAKQRQRDQCFIAGFTQGLEWIFGLQLPLLDHLRSTALLKLDMLTFTKQALLQNLLGRHGQQAELLCEA